jgi:hypothetical protein
MAIQFRRFHRASVFPCAASKSLPKGNLSNPKASKPLRAFCRIELEGSIDWQDLRQFSAANAAPNLAFCLASCPAFCRQWPFSVWFCWRCWPWLRSRTCTLTNLTPITASSALSCTRWCPVAATAAAVVIVQLGASTPQAEPIVIARQRQIRLFIRPLPSPARASFRFHSCPRIGPLLGSGNAWPHLHILI